MNILRKVRQVLSGLAVLTAALFTSACFESETTVNVKKDGSGTIAVKTVLGAQMAGMMAMAEQQEGGKNPLTDEEELKGKAAKMGEGVEYVGVEKLKLDDGRMGAVATYKFADVTTLKLSPGEGMPSDDGEDEGEDKQPITFGFTKGDTAKLTINMPQDNAKAGEDAAGAGGEDEPNIVEGDAADDDAMAMMAPMMQGMRIAMIVKVEGEITETNAVNKDGSTVTLMDIDMGKLFANKEVMKKMKNPDQMKDFAKFAAIAKEAGVTFEPNEKTEISFK